MQEEQCQDDRPRSERQENLLHGASWREGSSRAKKGVLANQSARAPTLHAPEAVLRSVAALWLQMPKWKERVALLKAHKSWQKLKQLACPTSNLSRQIEKISSVLKQYLWNVSEELIEATEIRTRWLMKLRHIFDRHRRLKSWWNLMKISQGIINVEIDENCKKVAKTTSTIGEATANSDAYVLIKQLMNFEENCRNETLMKIDESSRSLKLNKLMNTAET
jgi:hypothetical protein